MQPDADGEDVDLYAALRKRGGAFRRPGSTQSAYDLSSGPGLSSQPCRGTNWRSGFASGLSWLSTATTDAADALAKAPEAIRKAREDIHTSLEPGLQQLRTRVRAGTDSDTALRVGVQATLRDLKAAAHLNGEIVSLARFDQTTGRWSVRLKSNGELKTVRPEHLEIKAEHTGTVPGQEGRSLSSSWTSVLGLGVAPLARDSRDAPRLASLTEESVNEELERSKVENEQLLSRLRALEALLQKESEASKTAHADSGKKEEPVISLAKPDLEQPCIAPVTKSPEDQSPRSSSAAASGAALAKTRLVEPSERHASGVDPGLPSFSTSGSAMNSEKERGPGREERMEARVQQAIFEKDDAIRQLEEEVTKMKERIAQIKRPSGVQAGNRPCPKAGAVTAAVEPELGEREPREATKGVRNLRELYNKSKSTSDGDGANRRQLTKTEVQAKLTRLVAGGCADLDEVRRLRREVELLQEGATSRS